MVLFQKRPCVALKKVKKFLAKNCLGSYTLLHVERVQINLAKLVSGEPISATLGRSAATLKTVLLLATFLANLTLPMATSFFPSVNHLGPYFAPVLCLLKTFRSDI